ncbi:hypothetical protein [Mycolicibacterium thermoresistibile]
MGNRANIVLVENQDWQLYYSHWAGCRMLDALIGGPDLALRYVRSLRRCARDEWTHPAWADGGAVIDLDRRRVLFFGDELMVQMNERRALLTVLTAMWPDYQMGWAYDGTVEIAGYVGAEIDDDTSDIKPKLRLTRDRDELCHLVSVVDTDGQLRFWPLWWHLCKAWHGPALIDLLPGRGLKTVRWHKIPEGGVHIDVGRRTVGAWQTADTMGVFSALPGLWPGWRVECWGDRFEEQLNLCEPALRLPELDLAAGIDSAQEWIEKRVFQSFEDSPAGQIVRLAGMLAPLGPGLEVGADAVTDCAVQPNRAEWARFTAACDALRGSQAESA